MDSKIITLSAPLKTHSGEVNSITVNEPRAKSFFDHGEPFKARVVTDGENDRIEIDYNNAVLKRFLSDMTGIDDLILGGMRAKDFFALRSAATDLIFGVAGENPTAT
ncbi:MAG: hypothetical protein Q7V17_13805 [Afipia sp.]|nr:hypothetical protein [Afipia sp.]